MTRLVPKVLSLWHARQGSVQNQINTMDRPHPMNKDFFRLKRYNDRFDTFELNVVGNQTDFAFRETVPYYNQGQFQFCELIFRLGNTDHWSSTDCVSYELIINNGFGIPNTTVIKSD